ncbi:stage III sporulation protein AF [Fictibacillus macauensis ZFHKF-1]|uniref:Stage III sporulation protein AF n=1 Tax=Fictibacillus macauensis ZFHKF-1 TaxID=1196324 RepID=I8AMU2_9BACL|nr:stage III sporulation protein AF [Fictibacillus macauensis]EIT87332.1 stage III sporulation protein AF [Fictibacillus macauensis ZFHKF-1]
MTFLSEWVSNIVLVILLGIFVEMLVPNNQFQKYIKMVIGLLLMLAILSPLLKLAGVKGDQLLEAATGESVREGHMKNSLEMRKKEIESQQAAYISKQMRVQMKNDVKEELKKAYGVSITDLQFITKQGVVSEEVAPEQINAVKVTVGQVTQGTSVAAVQTVKIETSQNQTALTSSHDHEALRTYLSQKWKMKKTNVHVYMEGEEGAGP